VKDERQGGARRRFAESAGVLPVGTRVGEHVLDEEIARGGFGVVYRATHTGTGEPAAIKVLHAELARDATAIARFEREVAIAQGLQHPAVARILAQGRLDERRPYYVMELLAGRSLDVHLAERGRLSPEETLSILTPVASALDAAHARGIVHRDIKPSNVFLCDASNGGRVVLLDFGVAKLLDAAGAGLTGSRQIVGTLLYMAPEQFLQQPVDGRADVYALGALAYRMLTGQNPFGGSGIPAFRQAFQLARPPAPSTRACIPAALDAPILRALAKEPEDRQPTASAFVTELAAATVEAQTIAAPRPEGARVRPAVAVHAEVRVEPAAREEPDEALLAELEELLPIVSARLAEVGLWVATETGRHLLMVAEAPADAEGAAAQRQRVIEAAVAAHRHISGRPRRDARLMLGIAVHVGALLVNEDGTLLGGGLFDPASWVPATTEGVVASAEALAGLDLPRVEVQGAPGFYAVKG
jgi:serine/threonine-protein kinase